MTVAWLALLVLALSGVVGCGRSSPPEGAEPPATEQITAAEPSTHAQTSATVRLPTADEMAVHFAGLEGCLVLRDLQTGAEAVFNPERADVRFAPCSTFKIPNSLIALEDSVLTGPDESLRWDGVQRSREALNRDHTLRSAMSHSVVWFYQEIARRTGETRYRDWLAQMDYGNRDITGGLTEFWLDSSLQISTREQIEFLAKLHDGRLPFAKRSVDLVREIMTQERTEEFVYLGKTGSADRPGDEPDLGWWVGLLDFADGRAIAFAGNVSGKDAYGPTARRITEAILREQALLPPKPGPA